MNSVFCCNGVVVFVYLFIYFRFIPPKILRSFSKQYSTYMIRRATITKLHLLVPMAAVRGHEKKIYFDVIFVMIIFIFSLLFIFFLTFFFRFGLDFYLKTHSQA